MHQCEAAECEAPAEEGYRFCTAHRETLGLLLASIEIRCPSCSRPAPEGLMHHDCTQPTPLHPEHDEA